MSEREKLDQTVELQPLSPEDEYWSHYAEQLRFQALSAYNEAAKTLITAASLFLAFYGTVFVRSLDDQILSTCELLAPVILILLGVFLGALVVMPFSASIQIYDLTAVREYHERSVKRKSLLLLVAGVILLCGVIAAFSVLIVGARQLPTNAEAAALFIL